MKNSEIEKGVAYFEGKLTTTPIPHAFRPSRQSDVTQIQNISENERVDLISLAVNSLIKGEGVIATLAAGASSRMNTQEAPEEIKQMTCSGNIQSKAVVPIGKKGDQVYTFMGAFLTNIARLQEQLSQRVKSPLKLPVLIMSSETYQKELDAEIEAQVLLDLHRSQFEVFHQQLGHQYIARPEDVHHLKETGKIDSEVYEKAMAISKTVEEALSSGDEEAVLLQGEEAPLGHGEFFHQLVSSGTLLKLINKEIKWISIRNIDNSAATFDEDWLVTLGLFLQKNLDMQIEVSARSKGQKGGSLIVVENINHQIAEDPQILVSHDLNEEPDSISYWFNNAVAITSIDFILDIYKDIQETNEEFINRLKKASKEELEEIADVGRKKFPFLLDPKPAKQSDAISMKIETNLWQATGVVHSSISVQAVGVTAVKDIESDFDSLPDYEQLEQVKKLRMLATKSWGDPVNPAQETFCANQKYMDHILTHITQSQFIPENTEIS